MCGGALKSLLLRLLSLSWSLVTGILLLESLVMLALARAIETAFWVASWTVALYLRVLSPRRLLWLIVVFVHWPFPAHSLTYTFAVLLSAMSSLPPSSPGTKPFLPHGSDSRFVMSHQDTGSTGTKSRVDTPLADDRLAASITIALKSLLTPGSLSMTGGALKSSSPSDAPCMSLHSSLGLRAERHSDAEVTAGRQVLCFDRGDMPDSFKKLQNRVCTKLAHIFTSPNPTTRCLFLPSRLWISDLPRSIPNLQSMV